jgi:O-succinylbenzoate synthase
MRIDAIDVYWLKLPLAFVWKTSYADQHVTDTILVRMEGGGHHAWGESCPPYIPGYSADHTLAVYHTLREHMVPRIIGQEVETSQDILDRLAFIKGNQFARAALDIAWWVLDAKRRGLPLHRALGGTADRVAVGADFGIQDSLDLLRRCGRPSPTSPCTSTATRPTRRPTPPCSAPWTASSWP